MPAESQEKNWASLAENTLEALKDIQSMIDITSERLVALRDLRLQEFIKVEIRSLEGKLVKQFLEQLAAKCQIPEDHWLEDFQKYPSLSQWLTVVGVCNAVKEKLIVRTLSVESLLSFSEVAISNILRESGGNYEDERKLLSALGQLRGFNEKQGDIHHDTGETYWDSWTKTSCQQQNGDVTDAGHSQSETDVDYNENIQRVDQEMSKRPGQIAKTSHRILVNTASGRTTAPVWSGSGDHIDSNYVPPSPSYSSRSSLSSTGPPSPPGYGIRNLGLVQNYANSTMPTKVNSIHVGNAGQHPAGGPASRSGQSSLTSTPPLSRSSKTHDSVNPSASSTISGIPGNRNLLPPFGQMRAARSYEWQVGSHITAPTETDLTNSNLSLTSVSTLPPPSTNSSSSGIKLLSSRKKHKKRPENIVINRGEPPDFIDLLRPGNRRASQTMIASDNGFLSGASGSPISPRTPMTPGTPVNNEMLLQNRDYSPSPPVPYTLRVWRDKILDKIKDKIGIRSRLRRNMSEERVADEVAEPPSHHKVRSETFPVLNVDGLSSHRSNHKSTDGDRRGKHHTTDSRHSSAHSSASSVSSSQLVRMHNESSSFDANLLFSGMTTPGEASMLVGRDNFGFDMSSYYDPTMMQSSFTDTEKTLVPEEEEKEPSAGSDNVNHDADMDAGDFVGELEDSIGEREHKMRANLMRQTSTTSTMHEEWDVPWGELVFQERIGQGRVGAVYKGKWHGEVAIRVIDICHDDEFKLRAFKHEVMLYKKTRHDNVELFMGSSMNLPQLAIITGFYKGKSLYDYIRLNREQVDINKAKIIAQHVAQGMGYLHSRGIIHKDLKSKNIFIDGRRVTVTDFGLMGLHAISKKSMLAKPMTLQIPDGWLCYMAPEVIRALRVPVENFDVVSCLPYTKESDMYAFGTVWYELLAGCWPFKDYPSESIIWQVGNGKKQSLAHLQGAKELKDILMASWAYDPAQRPDFTDRGIMGQLLRLPLAKIMRRSSQPIRGRQGGIGGQNRPFDPSPFHSVLHELAE